MAYKKNRVILAILIIIIIAIAIVFVKKDEYSINMKYVGEIKTNTNDDFFEDFTLCYLIDDKHDIDDYPLSILYLHKSIDELEKAFNVRFEYKLKSNKYYICTYGRKIKEVQILFKYDEEDRDYVYNYYYAKIEYEQSFLEDTIYVYEVDKSNIIYNEMTCIDAFGKKQDVELVKVNNDSVSLIVFRNGEINPLFGDRAFNRFDVTTEIKVYYYKYEEPYLYVINKWGRCTLINVLDKNIIVRAETCDELSKQYKDKFCNVDSFIDISSIDDTPKENAIEFGNGTIYIMNIKDMNLVQNEKMNDSIFKHSSIIRNVKKYLFVNNNLYIIDEEEKYYVVNVLEQKILFEGYRTDKLPEEYKNIFDNEEIFCDASIF